MRLFDEIQDKSRQLEVASQHKSQFLANMSHELRTPLNAILGYTELMADGIYGELPEKTMGVLKRLESNGRHLLGLINDVLDLSKIEAGQLVLELSDYSLEDIAQTVRSTLEPLAADKKLAFKVEVAPKLPPGHGDGRRLAQVVINLVGNAIKFTDAGEVVIKATAADGSFHLSVCDTGPGISAADQAKLFQEFQQADNAITRKKGGTGLGLAISKRIIEMHGGKIWVESQARPRLDVCLHAPGHRRAAGRRRSEIARACVYNEMWMVPASDYLLKGRSVEARGNSVLCSALIAASNSVTGGTYVRQLRPSEALLRSGQRMHPNHG